jgi:hypothetical protein
MRKLYVLSKNLGGEQWLIGELSEENGEYAFEYKLGGKLPRWYLRLDDFPDINRVYRGEEVRGFIDRIIPAPDDEYIEFALESAGLSQYDEWAFLKYCGKNDPQERAYLREALPEGIMFA